MGEKIRKAGVEALVYVGIGWLLFTIISIALEPPTTPPLQDILTIFHAEFGDLL